MHVQAFDERHYAEAKLDLTIFRLSCNAPLVYLPKNFTSVSNPEAIPKVWKSKSFQTPSKARYKIVCVFSRFFDHEWSLESLFS